MKIRFEQDPNTKHYFCEDLFLPSKDFHEAILEFLRKRDKAKTNDGDAISEDRN